ncbi:MAG: polysaccharide lyase family 8 super-sandwich domain-containing protein, partial [Phycisphaeraceae bacterium]
AVFAYLATVPGPQAEEMAGLFARLWNPRHPLHEDAMRLRMYDDFRCMETPGRRTLLESVAATQPQPAPPINGCWVKPWAGLTIARGETWSVAIKGWSQYIWDFECHPALWSSREQNVFSRLISNGTVQVMLERKAGEKDASAVDSRAPGTELDHGWDWSRWPGSTATHLPLDRLYNRDESWQNRWFSDETFLGGVGSADGQAVFAVKLHDTCHDPSFRATKSWFLFGHEIVCLGSGISCSDAEAATQTTLFQCYLPDAPAMPIEVDGEAHATLPWQIRQSESVTRILDPYRNGFVVPAGQPLHIARQPQTSRDANNIRDTAGDYAVAWIDHGPAPSDQNYEYAMLVQTTPQQLADFADDPPYRVLQRDEHAHIVQHTRHDAIGYAIFTAEREITHGPLARTDTPVTAFAKPMPDGGLLFRVADPDLRLPRKGNLGFLTPEDEQQLREPHRVRLLLHGRWLTDAQTPAALHKYNDDQTLLEWEAAVGLPLELELRPWAESLG